MKSRAIQAVSGTKQLRAAVASGHMIESDSEVNATMVFGVPAHEAVEPAVP
ncbi:MAG: hypothetical protein ABR985_10385 [Methanotrichaceae archaeon]